MKTKITIAFYYWLSGGGAVLACWYITDGHIWKGILSAMGSAVLLSYPNVFGWWKEVA